MLIILHLASSWSKPFLVRHKHGHEFIQTFRVLIAEPADCRTIEIKHAEQSLTIEQRHDDLRIRSHITGNVSRKLVYIRHDDRLAPLGRHPAHALAHRDAHTRRISLKWSKHKLFALQEIKPGPV